ncbi:ATP-binding protein [Virgibacillus dakarensis]|uniref:Serine/threonine-protein kinase RsbT n=1 Tax=Lentibacillus populi TaxID=1827502 RepID=A0A9W5X7E7_9BACI|nr:MULTISPECIES: anti-sigma regulatory factor [Bacillaceae]MBT2218569.1 anti-sigma regulatory factor [Virgibacillus dakarensis]MTW85695.1 ATP-binding protein [Virgibacillus dakarensis]GGB55505.1 serine/threonine-protein kinase RsbT [Lentibacillus populi]
MSLQSRVNIQKEWDIVGARQVGRDIAKKTGFGTVDQARIATAISELARNIYLYASSGQIYFEVIDNINQKGICMIAVDKGPGIDDISQAMEDGFTTSGGLGAGLPGVKRLMDVFDIKSEKGKGTEIKAIKWLR